MSALDGERGPMVGGGRADIERLRLLQSSTDQFTRDNVAALGLPTDASCLELGAGAGAVAAWLATAFPDGSVLAVDIDTSALDAMPGNVPGNVTVEQSDISAASFRPGQARFDLIHCRFVLSHLPERDEIVGRAAGWLRPGGWLMLTEPFHLDPGSSPSPAVARVLRGYSELAALDGADLRWSRQMPFRLAAAGLHEVDFAARAGLMGGGDRDRWRPLLAPVATRLITDAGVAQADLDEVFSLLTRDEFLDIPQVIFSAWGRRPATDTG